MSRLFPCVMLVVDNKANRTHRGTDFVLNGPVIVVFGALVNLIEKVIVVKKRQLFLRFRSRQSPFSVQTKNAYGLIIDI